MSSEKHASIKKLIEQFLDSLHIEGEVEVLPITEQKFTVKISVQEDQGTLIGKFGSTLESLQHILNARERKERTGISYRVDVNDYQASRDEAFLKRVQDYIQEKSESLEVLLWPMSPYERRLVHEYFLQEGTHTTQSEDFGARRVIRVVKK